jgi:DNA-binding NtrC family response regulator
MRRLYVVWERIAASDVPVIIEGETGTGKEALAEAIHEAGPRASGPFVVFDCTAVAPSLVESELFGHERGAFTGALTQRTGLFEQADGGTLLIDEIGDMDPALQPKLLRAVERKEIRKVGGSQNIRVDVRVIAATRRDLDALVQKGAFRDDLFHRLAVTRIELPPLRRRRGDITLLARHFCEQLGAKPEAIAPEVFRRWEEYDWPGNVRELRNAVARQLTLPEMQTDDEAAPPEVPRGADPFEAVLDLRLPYVQARQRIHEAFERRYLERVLQENMGNVRKAAVAAGVGRRYFQRLRAKSK